MNRKDVLTRVAGSLSCALLGAALTPLFAHHFLFAEAQAQVNSQGQTASPRSSPAPTSSEPKKDMTALNSACYSVEDQNRLVNNGIGPAYILELKNAGYPDLSVAQLIAFRSNGVRADYIRSLKSVGFTSLPPNEVIALKTNGITPDVIKPFQALKYADFKATNYIAFKSNGVTPAYLKAMKAIGYDHLTPKQIVDLWVAGVTANFVKDARKHDANLSPEAVIELKRHGHP